MKILLVHGFYRQPGGEDEVFRAEAALLERHGHTVLRHTATNDDLTDRTLFDRLRLGLRTTWNGARHRQFKDLLRAERPEIIHCHNLFPSFSPALYHAASAEGIPVVQTIHNYRLLCPNGLLFRDGRPCEDCVGRRLAWPGIAHACYRDSRAATAAVAAMLTTHHLLGTWKNKVHTYIALTEFAKQKLIEGGLPAEKIQVKPNFVDPDPGPGDGHGNFALFVGRLSPEKGIKTLLDAWPLLADVIPLKIVGDGPLAPQVQDAVRDGAGMIEWLGQRSHAEVLELMKAAAVLIVPSLSYESFDTATITAFAVGLPVIASGHGALAEIVRESQVGIFFRPGHVRELASRIRWFWSDSEGQARLRRGARARYLRVYAAESNYAKLMGIYERAVERGRS